MREEARVQGHDVAHGGAVDVPASIDARDERDTRASFFEDELPRRDSPTETARFAGHAGEDEGL